MKKAVISSAILLTMLFQHDLSAASELYSQAVLNGTEIANSIKIQWKMDYEGAVKESRRESKPLFLLFTAPDWSHTSYKLNDEILSSRAFVEKLHSKFIFVLADFSMSPPLSREQMDGCMMLRDRYKVEGFPTIILLTPRQEIIGSLGYIPESAEKYADKIIALVDAAASLETELKGFKKDSATAKEMEQLYQRAKEIGRVSQADFLMQVGLQRGLSFFLGERYRQLVESGHRDEHAALKIRGELLRQDPENKGGWHLYVAVVEFQSLAKETEKTGESAIAAAPLIAYLDKFGEHDRNGRWRVSMMLAQFFLLKNEKQAALTYAKEAYKLAPASSKPDIARSVVYLTEL